MARRQGRWLPPAATALQLKITLKDIRPPIWRRVLVPDNYSLGELHGIIQVAMGWENCHMHAFRIGDAEYVSQDTGDPRDPELKDEDRAMLRTVIGRAKQKFVYEYDFGDSWIHDILVEKVLPFDPQGQYPLCLAGARACPPEDCGSVPGYYRILEAMQAPRKTAEQKELLEWLGGEYDPAGFDIEAVNEWLSGKP